MKTLIFLAYLFVRPKAKSVRNTFAMLIALALHSLMDLKLALRWGRSPYFANAEIGAGTHHRVTTKFTNAQITTRHLLYKFDTTDATGKRIVPCGLGDRAIFAVPDEVLALDLIDTNNLAPIEAIMLGVTSNSVRMIANAALTPGTVVYPAANGTVDSYANIGTGSNFACGVVLVGSTANGQIIEVASFIELQVSTV